MQQTATSFKSFKQFASERAAGAHSARAIPAPVLDSIVLSIEVPFIFDHQDPVRSVFARLFRGAIMPMATFRIARSMSAVPESGPVV